MDDAGRPPVEWLPPRPRRPLTGRQRAAAGVLLVVAALIGVAIAENNLHLTALFASERTWEPTGRVEFAGDTWEGNLVVVGSTVYLLAREDVDGFWGDLYLHRSLDGGTTWEKPILVTSGDTDAARHSLTLGSDGALWAAWAQRGPEPKTQRLMLRRSRDGGLTWDAPTRVSRPDVRSVGIPALAMTDVIRLVAFTDGASGAFIVQRLDPDGGARGDPVVVALTSRQLYSDAVFYDAGLALAGSGDWAALVFDDGERLHLRTGDGSGTEWLVALRIPGSTGVAPRLVATADGFAALIPYLASNTGQLNYYISTGKGQAWPVTAWYGPPVFGASLSRAGEDVFGAWATCANASCSRTRIWLADMNRDFDRPASILAGSSTGPVGIEPVGDRLLIAWDVESPNGAAFDPTIVVVTGPRP